MLQIIVNTTQQNFLCMGGGQDKPAWTACPLGVKITRAGGKISRDSLPPPGGKANRGWLAPRGGKLSRGQVKLGHRNQIFAKITTSKLSISDTKACDRIKHSWFSLAKYMSYRVHNSRHMVERDFSVKYYGPGPFLYYFGPRLVPTLSRA